MGRRPRSALSFWALAFLLTASRGGVTTTLAFIAISLVVPPVSSLVPRTSVRLYQSSNNNGAAATTTSNLVLYVQDYLKANHGIFFDLVLSKNDQAWKRLSQAETLTIFAVTDQGMLENVGDTKLKQLQDGRNAETVERMAEYHLIADDAVSAQALYGCGGVVTLGQGAVPVERTRSGGGGLLGLFGGGGNEDGGLTVGGARVVSTVVLADGLAVIHGTDNVVSPRLLWRYCDQLRIPGSK
jgi:uncharacterized surface protein with fasciclin (FAS1) repeats